VYFSEQSESKGAFHSTKKFGNFWNGRKWKFLGNFPENPKIVKFPKCEPFDGPKNLEIPGWKSNGTEIPGKKFPGCPLFRKTNWYLWSNGKLVNAEFLSLRITVSDQENYKFLIKVRVFYCKVASALITSIVDNSLFKTVDKNCSLQKELTRIFLNSFRWCYCCNCKLFSGPKLYRYAWESSQRN